MPLAPGQVIACRLRAGAVLQVMQGQLWLTRAGDLQDHVLGPGQRWVAAGSEQVLLSALGSDCACLSASVVRPWPWGRQPGGPSR
jgi:hypothetical protein